MLNPPVIDGRDLVNIPRRHPQATVGSEGGVSQFGSPRRMETSYEEPEDRPDADERLTDKPGRSL